jgi:hypothetical protein
MDGVFRAGDRVRLVEAIQGRRTGDVGIVVGWYTPGGAVAVAFEVGVVNVPPDAIELDYDKDVPPPR